MATSSLLTPANFYPARAARAGKVISVAVRVYLFVDQKKNLNRTLAIDSPFQTFTVGLLAELDGKNVNVRSYAREEVRH